MGFKDKLLTHRAKFELAGAIAKVTAREITANIKALNLYPFGIMYGRETGAPHPHFALNPRPVLLVHGVVHNASAFIPLRRRMESEGWKNIFTINYTTRHGSLTKMVDKLSQRVDEILKITGAKQVDIVGHSLGGVISRYYMSVGAGRGKVHHLVTLGTPHRGTHWGWVFRGGWLGGLTTDLRSGSYSMNLLNETALPRDSKLTSIYSRYDFVAFPGENCKVEGLPRAAFTNIELNNVGHLGLLYSEGALNSVMQALTQESSLESEKSVI